MGLNLVTATCTAQNTFTTWMTVRNRLMLTVSSTAAWVGTVTSQLRFTTTGGTAHDTDTFTADGVNVGQVPEDECQMRVGIKTGDYTSGKITVRLSQ